MTYKVVLKTVGKTYSKEGSSIESAVANMGLKWNDIKNKGVLTVSQGRFTHEHLFNKGQLQLLFANKTRRLMWSSRLEFLMKEGPDTNIPEKQEIKVKDEFLKE